MIYTLEQIKEIISPIARKYNLPAVYLFGSYSRGTADEDSDLDFLIDTTGTDLTTLVRLGALYMEIEETFQKPIDLITLSALTQPPQMPSDLSFRRQVFEERKCLYVAA